MGQVLHGSATTTEAVRRAIQHSQESLRTLAKRYGINPKTVAKWKKRGSVADLPTGPREPPAQPPEPIHVHARGKSLSDPNASPHNRTRLQAPLRPPSSDSAGKIRARSGGGCEN
jgi:hypothetical protein